MSSEAQGPGRFAGLHMDVEAMSRSLTGFDEIAIRKMFGMTFEDLPGLLGTRSLLFVQLRRDGARDVDAFQQVMEATLDDVTKAIGMHEDAEGNADGSTHPTTIGPTPTS